MKERNANELKKMKNWKKMRKRRTVNENALETEKGGHYGRR